MLKTRTRLLSAQVLSSGIDIFIGIDEDGDNAYERVYPTGLSDYTFHGWHMGAQDLLPQTPLFLELVDGDFTITYNEELVPTQANKWDWGNQVASASLSLRELTRDSDNDGLTNTCEECLLTNPHRKDTDGDGLEDLIDPHPQVDASKMNYLERGIARAMSFKRLDSMAKKSAVNSKRTTGAIPFQTTRLYLDSSLDVAWTSSPFVYGIIEKMERHEDEYGSAPNPSVFSKEEVLSYDPSRSGHTVWMSPALDCRYAFGYVREDRIEYIVYYFYGNGGDLIVLTDVAGELYPAVLIHAWMT